MQKTYHFSTQEHVQKDLESLIPHLKSCMVCNRFKDKFLYVWYMFRDNLSRRTFTTICIVGGTIKLGLVLLI